MGKKKFYVVWVGAKPGIYEDWDTAHAQVRGFPKAAYKSFPSYPEALAAYAQGPTQAVAKTGVAGSETTSTASAKTHSTAKKSGAGKGIITPSLSVDAACSGNPGKMEYQGVDTATKQPIFYQSFPLVPIISVNFWP